MRLILHTAAYGLILTMRGTLCTAHALATAEFATIRLRLLKLGTRVIESTSRVRLAFAAACLGGSALPPHRGGSNACRAIKRRALPPRSTLPPQIYSADQTDQIQQRDENRDRPTRP